MSYNNHYIPLKFYGNPSFLVPELTPWEGPVMKWFPKYPHSGLATPRRSVPRLEQLESRQVLSVTSVGVAFSPLGPEVFDVVDGNGVAVPDRRRVHAVPGQQRPDAPAWPSTAHGLEVTDVVYGNGALYQYDAFGTHLLANNVRSVGVAFSPLGAEVPVLDVVYGNGALYQYDAGFTHLLANSNVVRPARPSTRSAAR